MASRLLDDGILRHTPQPLASVLENQRQMLAPLIDAPLPARRKCLRPYLDLASQCLALEDTPGYSLGAVGADDHGLSVAQPPVAPRDDSGFAPGVDLGQHTQDG